MLLYLDTSAFIPLLLGDPSSQICRSIWRDSDAVCSSVLLRVEAAAALAQAERMRRLTRRQLQAGLAASEQLLGQMALIELSPVLTCDAAKLAVRLGLRGYDAVHAATARSVQSDGAVAAAGDKVLLDVWTELGLATIRTA